ncbi:MAG: sulfurtransferase-like selenium metabolism protein YedF [Deltaproteobacteria bacterium]|nr:sulfurtransferase-like selenium metabolism protein YedF [Deltaproteobacteria bacterium]
MSRLIDCKGLACPGPVLAAKRAIDEEKPETLTILVDNAAARENVARFLKSQGYSAESVETDGIFQVTGKKDGCEVCTVFVPEPAHESKIMILASSDRIGRGDDELGQKLMISYIKTLKEMGPTLWRLVFVNAGVKLTVGGSPVLKDLQALAGTGLTILVCGTCLNHFNLLDQKQVGETTNMLDIVTSMELADKVISV